MAIKDGDPDFKPMEEIIELHPQDPNILGLVEVLDQKQIAYEAHRTRTGKVFAITVTAEVVGLVTAAFALLPPDQAATLLVATSPATGPATIIGGTCAAFFDSLGKSKK